MHMSLSLNNISKLSSMSQFQPTNITTRHMNTLLKPIFVDVNPDENPDTPPIIYEIGSAGIMELHGQSVWRDISLQHFNFLLLSAAKDITDNRSLLYIIHDQYTGDILRRQQLPQFRNNFSGYILHVLSDDSTHDVAAGRHDDDVFMTDIREMKACISSILDEERFSIE